MAPQDERGQLTGKDIGVVENPLTIAIRAAVARERKSMDEQQNNLPAVNVSHDLTPQVKLYTPVTETLERLDMVRELRQKAMKSDVHFGIIPGTNDKPALWQAGADMLRMMFNL